MGYDIYIIYLYQFLKTSRQYMTHMTDSCSTHTNTLNYGSPDRDSFIYVQIVFLHTAKSIFDKILGLNIVVL